MEFSKKHKKSRLYFSFFLVLAALNLSTLVGISQAGDYDGIWISTDPDLNVVIIRHNDGVIYVAALESGYWEAYSGSITGTTATISSFVSAVSLEATIYFNSLDSASVEFHSCSPMEYCDVFPGLVIEYYKYW